MAKTTQLISLTFQEKKMLKDLSDETGIPISRLLLDGFAYWLKNNPKGLKELANKFSGLREERDVYDSERLSGVYAGSFKKEREKIRRIRENPDIDEKDKRFLIAQIKEHYKKTRRIHRNRLGISTHDDRLEEFKESHKEILEGRKHGRKKS